jgi:magnesium-protoporphyrin IX monomethyl ester (oxidative) cyclase
MLLPLCPQARPEFVNDFVSKVWSRFFCLSVYITMYLNDHQRSAFYESLGLNTTQVRGWAYQALSRGW